MDLEIHEVPIKEWSEEPSEKDIIEITDTFEANCIVEGKDPKIMSRNMVAMTEFLIAQNMSALSTKAVTDYVYAIRNLLAERYPSDEQTELDLS